MRNARCCSMTALACGFFFNDPSVLQELSYLIQIRGSLQRILEDKQGKIRVGLTMIGLSDTIYWLSWAILIIGKGLIIVVILTLVSFDGCCCCDFTAYCCSLSICFADDALWQHFPKHQSPHIVDSISHFFSGLLRIQVGVVSSVNESPLRACIELTCECALYQFIVARSFLATAFFSKARLGAIVGYLIFLFSMLGGIALE